MHSFAVFVSVALPWLNPFSFGPSPGAVQWLITLGSFALVLPWIWRAHMARVVASACLFAALMSAAMGLVQYFGASAAFQPWINTTATGEAFANLRQRNQFATLTNLGLAALLALTHQYQIMSVRSVVEAGSAAPYWRLGSVLAAVLLALGNAASSSRTGVVQLLLLLAMTWVWRRNDDISWRTSKGAIVMAAALAYIVGAVALPALVGLDPNASGILGRLHDTDARCLGRLTLWSNVIHLIGQKPWWGWGWGELDYAHFITLYPGERFCDILDNAHNLPLHLAVELGVPVAAAVCGFAFWLIWRCKPWREADAMRQLAWAVMALILVHSMLEYPLWYGPFQVAFGLSAILLCKSPDQHFERSSVSLSLPTRMSGLTAIVLLVAVVYAGWDYRRISQIYQSPAMRVQAYRENTLEKIQDSWLFSNQVHFAELTIATLTPENAAHIHDLAADLLHFSPEPRVIEKLIESAALIGMDEERQFYLVRYQAAFPQNHAHWLQEISKVDSKEGSPQLLKSVP